MNIETLLLIICLALLAGVLPIWPHSRSWGISPIGVFTWVMVIFLIWALAGGRPLFKSRGGYIQASAQVPGEDI